MIYNNFSTFLSIGGLQPRVQPNSCF